MKIMETEIQLQGILKPRQDICPVKELYFHKKGRMLLFDGFFNLFYIEKWKHYTMLERLYLSIRVRGFQKLLLFHNRTCIAQHTLDAGCKREYKAEFPLSGYETGVFWFALMEKGGAEGQCKALSGFYTGKSKWCRQVVIGMDICTFHREGYVERNLNLLQKDIFRKHDLQVAEHLWIYIVDNGRTLEKYEPVRKIADDLDGRVHVISSRNAGGAGGFTRGMLQVLQEKQEKKFTHVLLMDDDVLAEPDLLVRLYGFLSILKEEWRELTLGGIMLQKEQPYVVHCAGEYWAKGIIKSPGRGLDLRIYKNAAGKHLLTVGKERKYYSGWWCCCYSLAVVSDNNLPLPLFLHHDDIEFGMRNQKYGTVFLNGVSVWHRSMEQKIPVTNLYYDIRNNLIEMALHYPPEKAAGMLRRFLSASIAVRLIIYRPQELVMLLKGCKDFRKGPQWIWKQDPQELHLSLKDEMYEKVNMCSVLFQILVYMCRPLRKCITDYQEHMYQYANKSAWEEYLRRSQL